VSLARVALVCPDLMFGSRVEEALRAAGHEVTREREGADAVVVDLTADGIDLAELGAENRPTVGFYPHVDAETRRRALDAGFDVVVPRSRMARETAAVVEKALAA
jgi:DNA-binding NarL/FixJ family response regulator